jgi:hypothetical protein
MKMIVKAATVSALALVLAASSAEAQGQGNPHGTPPGLEGHPLQRCQTMECFNEHLPRTPPPGRPDHLPWPPGASNPGRPTTTPEPATIALIGTGLVGIAAARRRRRDA